MVLRGCFSILELPFFVVCVGFFMNNETVVLLNFSFLCNRHNPDYPPLAMPYLCNEQKLIINFRNIGNIFIFHC